jgi:hypothetical protein
MPLRYGLVPNYLTDDPNDFMGIVTENETVTTSQIIDQMIGKGSTVTKAEALSVIEEFSYAVVDSLAKGNNVNTELFKVYPSISGVFADKSDGFDASRHAIRLNLNAGPRLKEALASIQLRKVEVMAIQPVIQQFADLKSKLVNESFSPGQIASLKGSMLKFDEADPNQGIYFIGEDGTATKVTQVAKNKPSELLFFTPEGLTGSYQVEVRTLFQNTKSLRVGRLLVDLIAIV